ncbi:ABC transporter permease [Halieaceae bacterium]|jgi:putative ABC transport system permease protein|nr:ABC transporter permease [Halieaceae bacterium]
MRASDQISWIFRAVWMQKVRSSLTILGFAVGIAAMVVLSSMGEGLRLYVMKEFTQFGSHIVAVTPGKTETFGIGGILNTTRPLSLDDVVALGEIQGVEEIIPVSAGTSQVKVGALSRYTNVYGVGSSAHKTWKLPLAQGVFLPDEDINRPRAFAVLGAELKHELFGTASALGEYIHVGGSRFRIIGVTAPKGDFMGTDMDDAIYVPAAKALQLFNRESLMEVDIFYNASMATETIVNAVKKMLIERHGFEDFTIVTQDEMLETMDNILNILKYAGGGLGAISLLVGGVGIATILMITVTERTAEVGLLRALGSTRRQVRNLFLGEAIMLGLIGGIAGILAVVIMLLALKLLAPGVPMAMSAGIVTTALGLSMLIGLIAGVSPAMKATQLSPIDALRAE